MMPTKRTAWYVLHVKPRVEKKVAIFLLRYGFPHHLPLYLKTYKVQRRKVRRWLPVFPGYVFARLSPEERIRMLQTNLLVRTISVPNQRELIHQLRQIRRVTRSEAEIAKVALFKEGDYVRVLFGPMRGAEGYVKRHGRDASLCLNLDILGTAVEVFVPAENLEVVK